MLNRNLTTLYLIFKVNNEDSSLKDEDYLRKQLEAQTCLKNNLVLKFDKAKNKFAAAMEIKKKQDIQDKVEAYNAWREEEEMRGRAQDEHGRSLVKAMMETVKTSDSPQAVNKSMCSVLGNVDGKE